MHRVLWSSSTIADSLNGLDELPDEIMLLVLEDQSTRCMWHRTLSRLSQVSHRFACPAALTFPDDEALSLPERAAKRRIERAFAQPPRPDGLSPCRTYERRAGETYRHVLQLLEVGLLTRGVMHDVPVSTVESSGWRLAYQAPYDQSTTSSDLLVSVPLQARYVLAAAIKHPSSSSKGSTLLRWWQHLTGGATPHVEGYSEAHVRGPGRPGTPALLRQGSESFALLAWGRTETVLRLIDLPRFPNRPLAEYTVQEDDVHWYLWPNNSFGFFSSSPLDASAALGGLPDTPEDWMSWNLIPAQSAGGLGPQWRADRAGRAMEPDDTMEWHKALYYRM